MRIESNQTKPVSLNPPHSSKIKDIFHKIVKAFYFLPQGPISFSQIAPLTVFLHFWQSLQPAILLPYSVYLIFKNIVQLFYCPKNKILPILLETFYSLLFIANMALRLTILILTVSSLFTPASALTSIFIILILSTFLLLITTSQKLLQIKDLKKEFLADKSLQNLRQKLYLSPSEKQKIRQESKNPEKIIRKREECLLNNYQELLGKSLVKKLQDLDSLSTEQQRALVEEVTKTLSHRKLFGIGLLLFYASTCVLGVLL